MISMGGTRIIYTAPSELAEALTPSLTYGGA